jgi:formylglycine-generating enzyme required for sulfatase activity
LFISHSSKDNVAALALQRWLEANGWSKEDVFVDLHAIGAGERWRDALRKANASCEAIVLLASPDSLESRECQREINLAEDLGKVIIVAILRDVQKDDPQLARYADRQFVDLSASPTERMDPIEHEGKVHRVEFNLSALASIKESLNRLGIAPESFAWKPKEGSGPYPGLAAFGETDAGIFFGREAEIMAGVTKLRMLRKRRVPRLLVVQAASGAGKSSFLRAGLWPRLSRDRDFAPLAILRPALGILTGPDGLGRRFAAWFERHGTTKLPGHIHAQLTQPGDAAAVALVELVTEAAALATIERRAGDADARPPAPLIAIDQGEELFAAENVGESERFLQMLAQLLNDPPPEVDPYALLTIRADSVDAFLQRWSTLGDTPETQFLSPLSPTAYRDVIVKPAEVYSRSVRRLSVEPPLLDALVSGATGADALPLLAFTLERLFNEFGADGRLTLQRYEAMGGVGGSIDRALAEAQRQAASGGTTESLRRLIVPGLATWDPEAGAAKRLVASESDLVGGKRAALAPLADALVANRLLTRGAGTLEVAHEALLRRQPIAGWLEEVKDDLKLRDDVLREARDWVDGGRHDESLVRRGERLKGAVDLLRQEDFSAALAPARDYLAASQRLEAVGKRRARMAQALGLLLVAASVIGFFYQDRVRERYRIARDFLNEQYQWRVVMGPSVLSVAQEKTVAGTPKSEFAECARGCPGMVVVPAGELVIATASEPEPSMEASPASDPDEDEPEPTADVAPQKKADRETPPRMLKVAKPLAVGRTTVTFAQWDICVAAGGCPKVSDNGWGRGDRPVISVTWEEATGYVTWLKRMTGADYRLLSGDEWEYAARAGNAQPGWFRDGSAKLGDHAWFMRNAQGKTEPVGKKQPNGFGLYDMLGNVWQWGRDCNVLSQDVGERVDRRYEEEEVDDDFGPSRVKGKLLPGPRSKSPPAERDKSPPGEASKLAQVEASKIARDKESASSPEELRTNSQCAVRGGSWQLDPRHPLADRSRVSPDLRSVTLGFRVARTLNP